MKQGRREDGERRDHEREGQKMERSWKEWRNTEEEQIKRYKLFSVPEMLVGSGECRRHFQAN